MKVLFIGDTHGFFKVIDDYIEKSDADMFIQVGDFGYYPNLQHYYIPPKKPINFIEGNHDHIPSLVSLKDITEVWPNAFYIPRGHVMQLGNSLVGFLGGADSVDYKFRSKDYDWWTEEQIMEEDCQKLLHNLNGRELNLLVTHTPPQSIVDKTFDAKKLLRFGLSPDWTSISGKRLDNLWELLKRPPIICGHMHESVNYNGCRILNINEPLLMEL